MTTEKQNDHSYSAYWPWVLLFMILKLGIHLYTNAFAGYGIFRDELYFYACSLRPDIGYVDQPPLSVWVLSLFTMLFGKSVFALRFLPAVFGTLALLPLTKSVWMLGGKRNAIIITSLAFLLSPIYMAYCGYFSMNSIDILLWNWAIYLVIRLHKAENRITWLWLALVMGLALLNKIGMMWFGFGFFLSLVLTSDRKWLVTKWPYISGGLVFLLFSPYIIWNAMHGWPTLEFIGNTADKYDSQSPLTFLSGQLLINNPSNIIVWVAGIVWLMKNWSIVPIRSLGIIFITILAILLFNGHSKPEYLSQIFFVLLIGGGLALEAWAKTRRWIIGTIVAIQLTGLATVPLAIPILPLEKFIEYSQALGLTPTTTEGHELAELPQFYADMFGWENQAKAIARVYHSLPKEDQLKCVIFGDNYGRSGAVDYYASQYNLPLSIGRHNNYWLWGPGRFDGEVLILLSDEVGDKSQLFEEVTDMGVVQSPFAIPYENNLHVFVCRRLKIPVEDLWKKIKNYS